MANEQNLIPIEQVNSRRSREKHSNDSAKGGKKSGEVRRQRKAMKDTMKMLLNLDLPESDGKEKLKEMGIEEKDLNIQTAILTNQVQRALKGDLDSAKFCRDTSGEYIGAEEEKEERQNKAIVCIPAKNMAKSFIDVYRSILNREYVEYWLEGGRGSTKSSFAGEMVIELLENNPNMCAIVIRRYTNTLKDSVGAQLEWAVSELNDTYPWLTEEYTFKKSPLEAVKKETNQRIYFRGTDDPGKIKSIKPPKGMYIGIIWYEEFDQIQGMNAVRKINQSIVRGGEDFIQLYTYNTPASRQHFVNKEKRIPKKNRLVHLSDYRSVPKEWLGQAFIDEAEFIQETAPKIYENEYLGLETGDGGNVFENLEVREITDEEIKSFDWIYKGIDWGWYPDPFAYNNMYYNSQQRTLYIFDEIDCNKKSNAETWQMLKDKGVTEEDLITADSAEPKSIGDYRDYGANIRGAIKGPGSVEYSMKWLSSLNKIVIDRQRCPNTAREFEEYELERDKDGNIITGYPDKNNHNIDAVRYRIRTSMVKERRIMFEKFLNWIKGVIGMFNKNIIKSALSVDVAISSDMANAITLWEKIYENEADWLKKDEVESLELGSAIANEFTRLTTLEMKTEITGSPRANFLNEQYKKMLKNLNDNLEIGNAVGGLIFKPYVKDNKLYVDLVKGSCFYPTEFNSSKEIIAGIFTSQLTKGDDIYTRLEYHKFYEKPLENNVNYIIKNIAYKSNNVSILGTKIDLIKVQEWANIQEETAIQYIEKPLFSYYKPPIANNIDPESPIGVSVYARATDLIKKADKQFGRIDWEYEASEKAVYVDELATRPTQNKDKKKSFTVNKLKGRLYKTLNTGTEKSDFFKDYSPEIRDEALWRGLNKILQRIEFNVGLAYGTLSEPNTVDKTATEIKSSKQRSYATVSKMQENLQKALENLIYAMDALATLYNLAPQGNYEVSFNWDDSLIVDTEREQTLQMQEVNAGLRSKIKYIMFRYGLTEEQAKEELELINQEKQTNAEMFGFPKEE